MKYLFIPFFSLLLSSQVYAWTLDRDFEAGAIGAKAQSDDIGFDEAAGSATYVSSPTMDGSNVSVKTTIQEGDTGFGQWGGRFFFPKKLGPGDELWVRTFFWFPNDFDFTTLATGLKTVRIHTPEGNIDTYIDQGHNLMAWSELAGKDFSANNPGGDGTELNSSGFNRTKIGSAIPKGRWLALEQYVKFASKPNSGIFRIWQDGKLIFEDTKTYTLQTSSSTSDFVALFTYWNSKVAPGVFAGAPQTQSVYFDNVVVTTEQPDTTDSFGNPFIGTGGLVFKAKPKPPGVSQN